MNLEELKTTRDLMTEVRNLAARLEASSQAFRSDRIRDADRAIANEMAGLAAKLSYRLTDCERAIQAMRRRKIAGYVVGYLDADDRRWMVCEEASWGNLMRTPDVESALILPGQAEARAWLRQAGRSQGKDEKGKPLEPPMAQLETGKGGPLRQPVERDVLVWPVKIAIGTEVLRIKPGTMTREESTVG